MSVKSAEICEMSKPMILYYDDASPPVRSCLMLIKMLEIDNIDCQYVDLFKGDQLSAEFLKVNPIHTVPVLVDDELILTDSHTILMHLCDKFEKSQSDNSLLPNCYTERLKIVNMLFFECSVLFRRDSDLMSEIVRKGFDNIDLVYHERKIHEVYAALEQYLSRHEFMALDHMTLADVSIVTTLSTVDLMFPVVNGTWPLLAAWFKRMQKLHAYTINRTGLERLRLVIERIGKFVFPVPPAELSNV